MSLLTGQQIGELRDLLCERFALAELIQLVRIRLNETLENIVAVKEQSKQNIAFALIEWLEARARTREFLQAVRDERSGVEQVRRFCDLLLTPVGPGDPSSPGGSPDSNQVRVRVIQFSAVFGQRRDWFRYLNALKTLHEVLHKLQDMQEGIGQAVERFRRQPANALELRIIADTLEDDLVADAAAANQNTEFPEDADEWIGAFGRSVGELRSALDRADLATLDRAVEALRALPNQQAGLNKELVRCARRLKAEELVARMDGILAGLGQIPEAEELQAGLTRFRSLCQQVAGLTVDHDVCQDVATFLAVVVGPGEVTRDKVFRWPDVLAALLRIAGRRPNDPKAGRVAEYARAFDAAAEATLAAAQFALLREQFGRLFSKTDEDLLKVTDKLVQEAALLDARLRRFT
jgi:hypothetical protein